MEGTKDVPNEALKIAHVDPARIRAVSWAPVAQGPTAPSEPVLPRAVEGVLLARAASSPSTALGANGVLESEVESELPPPVFVPAFSPAAEQKLHAAVLALKNQGERLAEQARSDSLELGILIARRILEKELSANLDGIFSLIKSAIRRAGEDHVTRVRLCPADIERFRDDAISDFSLGKIELVADVSLTSGDVMVDTDSHTIDGRLATRFEELVRQLDGSQS